LLGAPCNQFGHQENGSCDDIYAILRNVRPGNGFEPNFVLLEKADVNGFKAQPLFKFLRIAKPIQDDRDHERDVNADASSSPLLHSPPAASDVLWNFEKFLIDRTGKPRYRFLPGTQPSDLKDSIETLLNESE